MAAKTIRLIPSHYLIDKPALAPLAESADELAQLEALDAMTSGRIQPSQRTTTSFLPTEELTRDHSPFYNVINAAFAYSPPLGNRFNDSRRGAWYCAYGPDALETALAEILYHPTIELRNTGTLRDRFVYAELFASFASRFHDLSDASDLGCLHPDPAISYPHGQAVAAYIRGQEGNGLLYPSTRKPGGKCLVAFRPHVVQNVRRGGDYQLLWDGEWETEPVALA